VIPPARYTESEWPVLRNLVEGFLDHQRPHTCHGLVEADVTDVLAAIGRRQRELRVAVSFHAHALHALGAVAMEHRGVLTYRRGRRLLVFDDADIATTIERKQPDGTAYVAVYTVRGAQAKSLAEINWELREAVRTDQSTSEEVRRRRRLAAMPRVARNWIWRRMLRDPLLLRDFYGTIGLTAVSGPTLRRSSWAFPPNVCTTTVAISPATARVRLDPEGRPVERRIVTVTISSDHLIMDGIPHAMFGDRLAERLESVAAFDDGFVEETRRLMEGRPIR
jgi:hypothetical protein